MEGVLAAAVIGPGQAAGGRVDQGGQDLNEAVGFLTLAPVLVYTRQAPGRRAVPGRLREASSSLEKPA